MPLSRIKAKNYPQKSAVIGKSVSGNSNEIEMTNMHLLKKLENVEGWPGLKKVIEMDKSFICNFCQKHELDNFLWGIMYTFQDITAHYFCLLFSDHIYTTEEEGVGFFCIKVGDIRKKLIQGKKIRCEFCNLPNAIISCAKAKCNAKYHYPCGLEQAYRFNFLTYSSRCSRDGHPDDDLKAPAMVSPKCSICYTHFDFLGEEEKEEEFELDRNNPTHPIMPPCCPGYSFHRSCVAESAYNAGDYFSCPICSDKETFLPGIKKLGIYCPAQEASWETGTTAFPTIATLSCKATECQCPYGPEYSSIRRELNDPCRQCWNLIPCHSCAGFAKHRYCGNLDLHGLAWNCETCERFVGKICKVLPVNMVSAIEATDQSEEPNKNAGKTVASGQVEHDVGSSIPSMEQFLEMCKQREVVIRLDRFTVAPILGPFTCQGCQHDFSEERHLKHHLLRSCGVKRGRPKKVAVNPRPRPFICGKCSAAFLEGRHLSEHQEKDSCWKKKGRPAKVVLN